MNYATPLRGKSMGKMQHVKVMGEVVDDGADKEDGADKKYDEWEIDDACRTLHRAEEIKADSKLMAAVKPHLEKKAKAYKSLSELKQLGAAAKSSSK